jgi:DNA-binding winged helix-turn-helix (wHTH) protein
LADACCATRAPNFVAQCARPLVPAGRIVYRFGPFTLDPEQRRLFKHDERVLLAEHPLDILICLLDNAGRIVDKDTLIAAAWKDQAVTDDSLRQSINKIRDALGKTDEGSEHVHTRVKRGYEFAAPVERVAQQTTEEAIEETFDTFRAFVNGRAALESLDIERVNQALATFERLVREHPALFRAHLALAVACFLAFESTRATRTPDTGRLKQAEHHARCATRLNDTSADAWGTLALVKHRLGETVDALAAARRSVDLAPRDPLNHLRHAAVSWGQERINAAQAALAINPDLGLACWLAATVYVARGHFPQALEELRRGCAIQDAQSTWNGGIKAIGLHWLHGLVLAAMGHLEQAIVEFERELDALDGHHLYDGECRISSKYAHGVVRVRLGQATAQDVMQSLNGDRPVDTTLEKAIFLTYQRRIPEAAQACGDILRSAPPGSAGWMIPVEPVLNVSAHRDAWEPTLALLRARAM